MKEELAVIPAPRLVGGEPVCVEKECPAWRGVYRDGKPPCTLGGRTRLGEPCVPGLRAQRDAAVADRACEADTVTALRAVLADRAAHVERLETALRAYIEKHELTLRRAEAAEEALAAARAAIQKAIDSHWGGYHEYSDEEIAVRKDLCAVLPVARDWRQRVPDAPAEAHTCAREEAIDEGIAERRLRAIEEGEP